MLYARSLFFNVWLYVTMFVYGIVLFPVALCSRDGTYWVMKLYSHHTLFWLRAICGTGYEVRGTPPETEVILASKHQSFIDMCILMVAIKRPRYISKRELIYAPILGQYGWRIDTIWVNRGKRGVAVKSMLGNALHQREQGIGGGPIVIFPQGTRVAPGIKHPYKIGAWRLYDALAVPCVPAATNAGLFWGRRTVRRYPGTIVLEFLDPIAPGLPSAPFMAELEERVEAASDRLNAEAGFPNGRFSASA